MDLSPAVRADHAEVPGDAPRGGSRPSPTTACLFADPGHGRGVRHLRASGLSTMMCRRCWTARIACALRSRLGLAISTASAVTSPALRPAA
jgi:hypothetical protein